MKGIIITMVLLASSCAKIPVESLTLTQMIASEGARMHQLNIVLINGMFKEKRVQVDLFIKDTYAPTLLKEFKSRVPDGTDLNAELPEMMESLIPKIMGQRDQMQAALEAQRIKLVTKLDADFANYKEATAILKELLESAIKVNDERKALLNQLNKLSGNKIDLAKIEESLDDFIIKGGNIGGKITDLNQRINSLVETN